MSCQLCEKVTKPQNGALVRLSVNWVNARIWVDINRRGYQRNRKFLRATSEIPNTTFENMTEETLETMKYDIENKAVTQSSSKGTHSLIKDVQQEQKGADTKNSKLESKSPSMKTKSEVLKERAIERDDHMRNENGVLRTKTRVIKKPNRYNDCVI